MSDPNTGQRSWMDVFGIETAIYKARALSIGLPENGPIFVDIGGGAGEQCSSLKSQYPSLRGRVVLQDKAEVLGNAKVNPGIEKIPHDVFTRQPVQGSMVYYLRDVLKDYREEQCITIIRHTQNAMGMHSVLLIDEVILPNGQERASTTDGRTEKQWKHLVRECTLQIESIKMYNPDASRGIVTAVRIPTMA